LATECQLLTAREAWRGWNVKPLILSHDWNIQHTCTPLIHHVSKHILDYIKERESEGQEKLSERRKEGFFSFHTFVCAGRSHNQLLRNLQQKKNLKNTEEVKRVSGGALKLYTYIRSLANQICSLVRVT
jgi:hypothetical protein